MRRSVKNYLCVLLLVSSLYFMGMTYLRAEETRSRLIRIERTEDVRLPVGWYLLTGFEGLLIAADVFYLAASKGNKKTFKETMDSVPVRVIAGSSVVAGAAGGVMLSVALIGAMPEMELPQLALPEEKVADAPAVEEQEPEYVFPVPELPEVLPVTNLSGQAHGLLSYSDAQDVNESAQSDQSGQSVVLAEPGAQVSLISSQFAKTGDSENIDDTLAYGLNADVFVRENAAANILGSRLTTAAAGAPGAVSNGDGSALSMSDSSISTSGDYSPAVMALFHGSLSAGNDQLSTSGSLSPVVVAQTNGTAAVNGGSLGAYGAQSPLLYGDGLFDLTSVYGTAPNSSVMDLKAGAQVSLTSTTVSSAGLSEQGKEGAIYVDGHTDSDRPKKTVINLVSDSISTAQAVNGEIPIPLFHIFGGQTEIHLSQCALRTASNLFGFIQTGQVDMTFDAQSGYGSYIIDQTGILNLSLLNGSSYAGLINAEDTGAEINIHIDSTSTLSLNGDIYVTSLSDDVSDYSNIAFNGYMIYVQGAPLIQ